jgi:AraC-like DNA-binding protein
MSTFFHRQTGTTIRRYMGADSHAARGDPAAPWREGRSVMLQVGYRSKKNFYRQFAAAFGVTPGDYKTWRARRPDNGRASQLDRTSRPILARPLLTSRREQRNEASLHRQCRDSARSG